MPGRIHSAPADKKGTGVPAGREPRGVFGADMQVYIQNDGPVTIVLDTDEIMPKRVTVRKAGAKENA